VPDPNYSLVDTEISDSAHRVSDRQQARR